MSTGVFTHRRRSLADLAEKRLRESKPDPADTLLALRLGAEVLGTGLTRAEAAALVRERAVAALQAMLERGGGYPVAVFVCSAVSVVLDARDGTVTSLMARDERNGSTMEVRVTFSTGDTHEVSQLRRRASDAEPEPESDPWGTLMRR